MRANSLALRLFFSAAAWTVVILALTAILLSSLNRAAVERAFDRRLDVHLAGEYSCNRLRDRHFNRSIAGDLHQGGGGEGAFREFAVAGFAQRFAASQRLAEGEIARLIGAAGQHQVA